MSDYEEEDEKWVQWFCSLAGNEHFCEVAQSYIEDSFNLYGLRALVPNYQDALNIILDMTDIPYDEDVPAYAAELYGLIHARYIITAHGLDAMLKKYKEGDFGVCPRALCDGQPVVPAGLHDEWKKSEMKVFCPKCRDLYTPVTDYQAPAIDGAYFGTTFPHLFFMTYRELEPAPSTLLYVPRVFGYKIHNKHENRRRLAILAQEDDDEQKTQQQHQRRTMAGGRRKGGGEEGDPADPASTSRLKKRKQEA
uniref:Casein kinase II subunit beta n=1 Tax=Globisporangium ultimum (strain ATCC 200006 / CBS 805.95 / DAOM BR144) TaxID=431595 RepID=K3WHD7_GLOUD